MTAGDLPADRPGVPAYGVLLGVVDLVNCVEAHVGTDEAGYVWVLANARRFARPVPHAERKVGLFNVADAVVADALEEASPPGPQQPGEEGR